MSIFGQLHSVRERLRIEPILRLQVEPLGGARLQVHRAKVYVFLESKLNSDYHNIHDPAVNPPFRVIIKWLIYHGAVAN